MAAEAPDIEFIRFPIDEGIVPPPVPATEHLSEEPSNPPHRRTLEFESDSSSSETAGQKDAASKGYVLSAPAAIGFLEAEDSRRIKHQTKFDDTYVQRLSGPEHRDHNNDSVLYRLKMYWAVDQATDYSLFCHQPFFTEADDYSVLPAIIEPSVGTAWINCDIVVTNPFRLNWGEPLLQVVPVREPGIQLNFEVRRDRN